MQSKSSTVVRPVTSQIKYCKPVTYRVATHFNALGTASMHYFGSTPTAIDTTVCVVVLAYCA